MVDFRRCFTALAALAVCAGLASAQNSGSTAPFSCATNVSSTPQIRGEGFTELIGDITLTCTGGATTAPNTANALPQVNVTLFVNAPVTSRLLSTVAGGTASEALLLIDEPGAALTPATGLNSGFGASAQQLVCPTPASGCVEFAATSPSNGTGPGAQPGGTQVLVPSNAPVTAGTSATPNNAFNVFQGVVSGNSVTWFGVPVMPPGTTGITRTFRMTNVRIAANILFGGSAAAGTPVTASIAVSNSATLPITGTTPQVGFVQQGLITSSSGPSSLTGTVLNQCVVQTKTSVSLLTFKEGFGTAFKTRLQSNANPSSGQTNVVGSGAVALQNVPGTIYNSESGLTVLVPSSGVTSEAGLADFGTRLKATFTNVPTGVDIFVSVANVTNLVTPAPTPGGGGIGSNNTTAFAQLVSDENAVDSIGVNTFFQATSAIPLVPFTDNAPGPGSAGPIQVVKIPLTAGSGRAVWEVVNINPAAIDTLNFGVYASFTANVPQNSPPPGQGTVTLSFAPTPGPLAPAAFTTSAAAAASGSLPIPRFSVGTATPNVLDVVVCRTILLYPFVTNQAGFDTGLAIANTSTDAFATGPQTGSCTLKWYSGGASVADTVTANIPSGTVYTNLVSIAAPNFQGYMFAICQFQYAHGFAFISDLGAQKLAEGYLALVIPDPGPTPTTGFGNRSASLPVAGAGTGEITAH